MSATSDLHYEEAYDASIWNRKHAIGAARDALIADAAAKNLRIVEESMTFTFQAHTVPAIRHAFGERPGFMYWTIRGNAQAVAPA